MHQRPGLYSQLATDSSSLDAYYVMCQRHIQSDSVVKSCLKH